MQESFQITIVIIAGSILFVSLVFFIIFSAIMYRRARNKHEENLQSLKNKFDKEILEVNIETKQSTLNKVSEEIHDNIGQLLSLIKLNLHQLNKSSKNERIEETLSLTNTAIFGLRNIAHIISSNKLEDSRLIDLLQKEIDQINNTQVMKGELIISTKFEDHLSPEISLILYRMIQEGINNIIKHASASTITIAAKQIKKKMQISIKDDGVGFDTKMINGNNNGLQNLSRRAKLISADFKIISRINEGTEIIIKIDNKI